MIRNIGFGAEGTHTVSENDRRNKEELGATAFPMVHPRYMLVDVQRDMAYFERYIQPTLYQRFKEVVKNLLPAKLDEALTPFVSKVQRRLGIN